MVELLAIVIAASGVYHGHEYFAAARDAQLLAEINTFYQLTFLTFVFKVFDVELISLLEFIKRFGFTCLLLCLVFIESLRLEPG